jgi:hypothetical protein
MVPAGQIANLVHSDDPARDSQRSQPDTNQASCLWAGPGHRNLDQVDQPGVTNLSLTVELDSYTSEQATQDREASSFNRRCADGASVPELGERACMLLKDDRDGRTVDVIVWTGEEKLNISYYAKVGTDGADIPAVSEARDNVLQIARTIKAQR